MSGKMAPFCQDISHTATRIVSGLDNTRLAQRINQIINVLVICALSSVIITIKTLVDNSVVLDVALGLNTI